VVQDGVKALVPLGLERQMQELQFLELAVVVEVLKQLEARRVQ
jgi:hypothetical protein